MTLNGVMTDDPRYLCGSYELLSPTVWQVSSYRLDLYLTDRLRSSSVLSSWH